MSILKRIINWNQERKIPKNFNKEKEIAHITEEVTEILRGKNTQENVDGFADIIVYAVGAIWKLGYHPDLVMDEVLKHIESRKGKWNGVIGKWVKEDSVVYQPDFDKCIDID